MQSIAVSRLSMTLHCLRLLCIASLIMLSSVVSLSVLPAHAQAYPQQHVEQFTLQPTDDSDGRSGWLLTLGLADQETEVQLLLHRSVLQADYEVYGVGVVPAIDNYEGKVQGLDDSWVRITISGQRLYGLIDTGSGRYEITSEAVSHINYKSFTAHRSLIRQTQSHRLHVVNALSPGKAFTRVLPIAIVVDDLFDQAYNGHGLEYAISVINGVDGIFRQELGLAVKLELAIYADGEPFSNLPGASPSQLNSFRSFRQQTVELQSDIALVHLFSGSELPPFDYAGVGYAYIGTACATNGFDISVSSPYHRGAELAAHEIGHNLGAIHDEDTDTCQNDKDHLMYSVIAGATALSSCSVDLITASLQKNACFIEVHDGSITLSQSGSQAVVVKVSSQSSFSTVISPVVQLTSKLPVNTMPDYCHALGTDTINCTLPAIVPNEEYQFEVGFEAASTPTAGADDHNTVVAEYLEGGVFDANLSNNISEITLSMTDTGFPERVCIDADGDGYGWDGVGTCVPVPDSVPVSQPEFVNQATGEAIPLSDERWLPADIADRVIECHAYYFDSGTNAYIEDQSTYTRYRHSLDAPGASSGTVEAAHFVRDSEQVISATDISYLPWRLDNGYYSGPAPFSRSTYVQIVSSGGGRDNAIRSYSSDRSFDQCFEFPDTSGVFRPGASANQGNGASTNQGTGAGNTTCVDTPPLNDGWGWNGVQSCQLPPVQQDTAVSNPTVVIALTDRQISLDGIINDTEWQNSTTLDVDNETLSLAVPIAGLRSGRANDHWQIMHDSRYLYLAATVPDDTPVKDSDVYFHDDSLELFIDGWNQRARRYDADDSHFIFRDSGEVTGTFVPGTVVGHVRRYDQSRRQYVYEIQISKQSLQLNGGEFGLDLQMNNDQDGFERDSKWGWSGISGANTHWYELATVGNACLDTGPLSERCTGASGNTNTAVVCVDTGIIGDGWGWDGVKSCRIDQADAGSCIDTGIIGDGWGWDGSKSCRTGSAQAGVCIDTEPVGDGWGWDGVQSCRIQ